MASIQKRGEVYRVRVTRKGFATLSQSFRTRQEALKWARNTETQIDQGEIKPIGAPNARTVEGTTFSIAADYYLQTHTPLKQNRRSETLILKALRERFGDYQIDKLDQAAVAALRDEMLSKGRSGTTICHYLNAISKVYQMLYDEWSLKVINPATGIKRPKQNPPRIVRLSTEAVNALLASCNAASEPLLTPIVRLALTTAMRRGEILALDWKDIDTLRRRIYINTSKNGLARCIPASAQALAVLQSMPKTQCSKVFPVAAESLRKHYERAVRRAQSAWSDKANNPFTNLTFHDLRHQALSQLSDDGLNVIELAEVSGHRTLSMLKRYTHPSLDAILMKMDQSSSSSPPTLGVKFSDR